MLNVHLVETLSLLQGDAIFLWNEPLSQIAGIPSAWDTLVNSGLGQSSLSTLWITSYVHITALFARIGWTWNEILFVFWLLPALTIGWYAASLLFAELFPAKRQYRQLSGLFYMCNTYFLLVFFGGQIGVSLAYACVPLVIVAWVRLFVNPGLFNSLVTGLALSLELLFDPRIVFLTMLIVLALYICCYLSKKHFTLKIASLLILPFVILILLHGYWIFPLLMFSQPSSAPHLTSLDSFQFFSFADFSHALSLLHPNWPENIFGKISFLRPEFLLIPLLAFSSLLFIDNAQGKRSKRIIIFFVFLSLFGAFLAKGANEPLSFINTWFYLHIPGMALFRDPTKWYILTSLAYSILIPFTLISCYVLFKKHVRTAIYRIAYWFIILGSYTILFLTPFLFQHIESLVHIHQVPKEYMALQRFLLDQESFSRSLWFPKKQRFAYQSEQHPALSASELLGQDDQKILLKKLRKINPQILREMSIRYIVLPLDSEQEIFLDDRKYSDEKYRKVRDFLDSLPWLTRSTQYGKLIVYEILDTKDHFWLVNGGEKLSYTSLRQTEYNVIIKNVKKGDLLVFSDAFDPGWVAIGESSNTHQELRIQSEKYHGKLNSFPLPKDGSYRLKIIYEPQRWVERGLLISLTTFFMIVVSLIVLKKKKN